MNAYPIIGTLLEDARVILRMGRIFLRLLDSRAGNEHEQNPLEESGVRFRRSIKYTVHVTPVWRCHALSGAGDAMRRPYNNRFARLGGVKRRPLYLQ
jgi:hypothetical protein